MDEASNTLPVSEAPVPDLIESIGGLGADESSGFETVDGRAWERLLSENSSVLFGNLGEALVVGELFDFANDVVDGKLAHGDCVISFLAREGQNK